MIGGGYENIVDVKQEAASGTFDDSANEIRFAHGRGAKNQVSRRIFEKQGPPDRLLNLLDMVADPIERRLRIGQRKEVVKISIIMRRPGQMFRNQRRLVAL